jgi:hypothetical protein
VFLVEGVEQAITGIGEEGKLHLKRMIGMKSKGEEVTGAWVAWVA